MTAGRQQSMRPRRTGRIIERPRLIKLLDESDAPVILLVGPAGYGKTTLARQWARTLSGVIWVSCTPSHRDVVTFAEDIAAGIDALGGSASGFIGEYVRARSNPQRAAREIGVMLARRMNETATQWLVIDEFHELPEASEASEIVAVLRSQLNARLLVASRTRPTWASTREVVYGGVAEIDSAALSLTEDEVTLVIGRRPELAALVEKARGWPALVALAAALPPSSSPVGAAPEVLHRYVADELFRAANPRLRDDLEDLALLPRLDRGHLVRRWGDSAAAVIANAREYGFLAPSDQTELHPLLREFLLTKIAERDNTVTRVEAAVDDALEVEAWECALDLVLRFSLRDRIETVIRRAFNPLVRSGHLGTLSDFAERIRQSPGFPPPLVDLIDAEISLRDGQLQLSSDLAYRALERLDPGDPLRSRAYALAGQCHNFFADYDRARLAFAKARDTATDEVDETEALHGLAIAKCYGELEPSEEEVALLRARRNLSPLHLVRAVSAELTTRRYGVGLSGDFGLEEALHTHRHLQDPRARSSLAYHASNVLALKGLYRDAVRPFDLFTKDVRDYELDFATPFVGWTGALINLGLKRPADADRHIQMVEDASADSHQRHHALNARILRARLLLQIGDAQQALKSVTPSVDDLPIPRAWHGEYLAIQALCLACLGSSDPAIDAARAASAMTRDVYVQVFSLAAQAVARSYGESEPESTEQLVNLARTKDIWDPVLCAVRSSPELLSRMASGTHGRLAVVELAARAGDVALARKAGIRTRSTRAPAELLSPREFEVLGLIAQGRRNKEIAEALFIAESTVKVHVRHILERLGVRTRAEAVARYERLQRVS